MNNKLQNTYQIAKALETFYFILKHFETFFLETVYLGIYLSKKNEVV